MPLTIQVWEEAIHGERTPTEPLTVAHSRTTARELIRTRLLQQADRPVPSLLVPPEDLEKLLNGVREPRTVDREGEFLRACASFRKNGFLLFVDGVQITELDSPFDLQPASEVQFLKLVPLVGG